MSDFIPNLEQANARVRELEGRMRLAHCAPAERIEEANDRIQLLESYASGHTERPPQAPTAPPPAAQPQPPEAAPIPPQAAPVGVQERTGLQRAIAGNQRQQSAQPTAGHTDVPMELHGLQRAIAANKRKQEGATKR
jgi:hypothetical protein